MRKLHFTRARWLMLATLSAFSALAPPASADTTLPVWTCRASAGYVEIGPLLANRRVEPVLANGFADRIDPDSPQCVSADTGLQDINLLPVAGSPLIALNAAFATTRIDPPISAARAQTASAEGGVLGTLTITAGTLTIVAETVTSEALGRCVAGVPELTGSSTAVSLTVNGNVIAIPAGGAPLDINLSPLIRVRVNQQVRDGTAAGAVESLTQRAIHVEMLPSAGQPLTRVVVGESKVGRNGAVCAPAPPPPTCPAGTTAQPGSSPLVCVQLVLAPCPPGSTPNPAGACIIVTQPPCGAGTTPSNGTCIATPVSCPAGTTRDPKSNACVLLVQRPCPAGATADPTTRVCVVRVTGTGGSGENGRIGSASGPRATCGRLSMRFVRSGRRSLTNRFGNRVVTRGRLVTCGSNPRPIVGARVDVVHVLPGNKRRRKTGLRSRANGLLTLILPIDLRTRKIDYAYRPDLRSTRVTSRVILSLKVLNRRGRRV